ncbi:MAG: hypothetical protein H6741_12430 [Alphaproteobacteria bacterium]|nr:hypothetical protein [Alphaproteobacteria bacterium]
MATYDAALHIDAFENMERGLKTVYAVLNSPEYEFMSMGDRLEFGSHGSITVGTVRKYPDLEALCQDQGFKNVVPEANTEEDAIAGIRELPEWNTKMEEERGVLALRVRETRRK